MSQRASKEAKPENEPSAVMTRLSWQLALRDDAQVAQGLYGGAEIEEMHQLSEAGLLDEFVVFLKDIGMMAVVEEQQLPRVQEERIPTAQFLLLYLLKVLLG